VEIQRFLRLFPGFEPSTPGNSPEAVYNRFLAGAFELSKVPDVNVRPMDLTSDDQRDEAHLLSTTEHWLAEASAQNGGCVKAQRSDWLGDELESAQGELDACELTRFLDGRFTIEYRPEALKKVDRNCVYVKLNHGFWEILYALYVKKHMRDRPRRLFFSRHDAEGILETGFVNGLVFLLRHFSEVENDVYSFKGVHFAAGVTNGSRPHDDFLRQLAPKIASARSVGFASAKTDMFASAAFAASVGLTAFFEKLFPTCHVRLDDGCFPKVGYRTGKLHEVLEVQAKTSDRIVFAVPSHLRGLRLSVAGSTPRECIHLTRFKAPASWIANLKLVSDCILRHLLNHERVLAISQFGPYSVLLGLYLAYAARELELPEGCLAFFDLGQVPDIANPAESGPWLRRNTKTKIDDLFQLDTPRK